MNLYKNKMKHKILVTGGVGYIGSHTSIELIKKGFEVIIIDNLSNSEASVIDRIEKITAVRPKLYIFDLLNKEKIEKCILENTDIQGVIHFAAAKAVGESVERPLFYYKNNVTTLINLLETLKKYKIGNFVFSSSCTVYGQPDKLPVDESSPIKPAESPYGYTKQINENLLKDTIKASTYLKGIALRYFNPIGAHHSGLIGELPIGIPNNLMPFITQTAYGIREKLSVFGDDYPTPDGSCIRDYIHVVDLAKAHISALERLIFNKNKEAFEVFNIGTGKGFSVFEVIKSFEKTSGLKLSYEVSKRRAGDITQIWADTHLANKELGWKAEQSIDDMTLSAWKWENSYRK